MVSTIKPFNPYKILDLPSKQFWKIMKEKNTIDPNFYYYSDNINTFIEEVDISDDLKDIENLEIVSQDDQRLQNMNIWIGQKNVTTHAHYDSYDNIVVQIQGNKVNILFFLFFVLFFTFFLF